MKYIKLFVIGFILLITTGCSVNYDLKINEDESVDESATISEYTSKMQSTTGLKGDQAVNYLYNMFKRVGEDFQISYTDENKLTKAIVTTQHKSLEDYSSKFTSDLFREVNVTKKGNEVTINAKQSSELNDNGIRSLVYDHVKINIEVPFPVISSNADKINGDTYTWNIEKDNTRKTINIKYNVKNKKNTANIDIGNKIFNIKYEYIGIFILLFIVLSIVSIVLIKNKKNNSF